MWREKTGKQKHSQGYTMEQNKFDTAKSHLGKG